VAGLQARVRRLASPLVSRLALPLMVLLLAAFAAYAWGAARSAQEREAAARESVAAATAAARAIFSYDHKGFDAAVSNGRSFTAGDFTREYEQTTSALREAVLSEQATVRAEVSAAGVVTAGADRVEVLLYVNQFRRNVNIDGEKMDQNRIVLTMQRTPAGWKVVDAAAI
jgi:Mce-associated membrane protein